MKIAGTLLAALPLAACMSARPESMPAAPAQACQAERVQRFVGQLATPALVAKVRRQSGALTARRITPEMRVTMDFREDRVNVWVGLKGEAERISCG